ncbi:MAG: enoyl-CoA hydratase/isomerase family protein [Pirellulales bacterium]
MINVKVTDSVGTIVLERPEKCNALNRRMIEELTQALSDLNQEKRVRGIILTASGAHFCAGLDLKELHSTLSAEDAMQQWFNDAQAMQTLLENLLQLPKPIVAAVDGAALGSGLALVLACDLVVASHRASFGAPAAKHGVVAGLVAPLANFRCGAAAASRILIGADTLSATEAKAIGLVHHIVDPELIWVRAKTWLDNVAMGAAESIQLSKRLINDMIGETMLSQLASGAASMATSLTTEAACEGLAAFVDKREPKFPK